MSYFLWLTLVKRRLHGSYEALKYGTTLDGLADLTGGVTESLSLAGGGMINGGKDVSLHARTLARLLTNTSILTAVAHRQPQNNKENDNNNSANTNGNVTTAQKEPNSRSVTDCLTNGILVGINYKICSVEKVRFHLEMDDKSRPGPPSTI